MTATKKVEFSCNFPTNGTDHSECEERVSRYGHKVAALRMALAAEFGWRRVGEFDFCGPDLSGAPYRQTPAPNHAALLEGHDFTAMKVQDGALHRFRASCSCGWQCPQDAMHSSFILQGSATTYSRESASQVWLDLHVREDIAGLPRFWDEARIAEFRDGLARQEKAFQALLAEERQKRAGQPEKAR